MKRYFTKTEILLWVISITIISASQFLFGGDMCTYIASVIGITSLILNAKGNPTGQFLMIVFSCIYGYISYSFSYYGEMITYLAMTAPMALFALIEWLRHPFKGNKMQVEVNSLSKSEAVFMLILSLIVTFVFYYILKYFNTANLLPSTMSVTTSFIAVYLTFRRNPYFAIGYALNDIVLIVLWVMASMENTSYISVVMCFVVFLINDLYGFISWRKMEKQQQLQY